MKKFVSRLATDAVIAVITASVTAIAVAQYTEPRPLPEAVIPEFLPYGGENVERAISVSPNVNLNVCVTEGKLSVNGWRRNEVRIFVHNGNKFNFKVLEKTTDEKPVWISAFSHVTRGKTTVVSECLRGENVEIDLPVGATLNLKGKSIETSIDTLKRLSVEIVGGDVSVRNVSAGIKARVFQGGITVEESKGPLSLETTIGNIVVFEAGPSEIGDVFQAKTNSGAISLQRVLHKQLDVSSISGSMLFTGDILSGASYSFSTSNGSIRLALPLNSAFQVAATYGFGNFASDLPIKILTENDKEGPLRSIVANIGAGGDALLKLTTNSGLIGIRKQ